MKYNRLALLTFLAWSLTMVAPFGYAENIRLNEGPEAAKVKADKDFDRATSGKDETAVLAQAASKSPKSLGSAIESLIIRDYDGGIAKSVGRSFASGALVPPLFAGRGLVAGTAFGIEWGTKIGLGGPLGNPILGILGAIVGLILGTIWGLRIGLEGLFSGGIDEEDSPFSKE